MTRAQSTASHWSLSKRHTGWDKPRSWTSLGKHRHTGKLPGNSTSQVILPLKSLESKWLRPVNNCRLDSTGYQKVVAFHFHTWNSKGHTAYPKRTWKSDKQGFKSYSVKTSNVPFSPLGSVWQLKGNRRTVEIGLSNWNRQLSKTSGKRIDREGFIYTLPIYFV